MPSIVEAHSTSSCYRGRTWQTPDTISSRACCPYVWCWSEVPPSWCQSRKLQQLCFLWWPEDNQKLEPEEFMMTVHLMLLKWPTEQFPTSDLWILAVKFIAPTSQTQTLKEIKPVTIHVPWNGTLHICALHETWQNHTARVRFCHNWFFLLNRKHLCQANVRR